MTPARRRELAQDLADRVLANSAPKPITVALIESAFLSLEREVREELAAQRESFHMTYNGGHHDEPEHAAFHHGMDTVFNWLAAIRDELKGDDK